MKRIFFLHTMALLLFLTAFAACTRTAEDAPSGTVSAQTDAIPEGGSGASDINTYIDVEWEDFILFGGRYYHGAPVFRGQEISPDDVGERIGAVLHGVPAHVTSMPVELEDGTSFINPVGTPLYAVRGRPVEEAIAAGADGKYYLYLCRD